MQLHNALAVATPSQRLAHEKHLALKSRIKIIAECASLKARMALEMPLHRSAPMISPPDYTQMWFYDLVTFGIHWSPTISKMRKSQPRIEDIQRITARHFGITMVDILSDRRTAVVVMPRHVAVYLAKDLTGKSLPEIGRRFGRRDHTTALFAINKIERLRKTNEQLDHDIRALTAAIMATVR